MFENKFIITVTEENIQQYAAHLRNEERAAATIEKYSRDLKMLADFLDGAAVTKEAAIEWKEHLKATRKPPA